MATNTGKGSRKGAVKQRTQVQNPTTGQYVKRDAKTGQFIASKKDGTPFKGVKKEKRIVPHHPAVPASLLRKIDKALREAGVGRKAA